MESLHIPTRERLPGQTIWCYVCKTVCAAKGKKGSTQWKCKKNKMHIESCPNKLSQVYTSFLYNPFSQRTDIAVRHSTRDFMEFKKKHMELIALSDEIKLNYRLGKRKEAMAIIEGLKSNQKNQEPKRVDAKKSEVQRADGDFSSINKDTSLEGAMIFYNEWLKGKHRAKWESKVYAKKTITNYQRSLNAFHACMVKNKYSPERIAILQVNEVHKICWANEVYSKGLSNDATAAYINDVNTFLKWCVDRIAGKIRRRTATSKKGDKTVTTIKDFVKMVDLITPENGKGTDGYKTLVSGRRVPKKKNYYRPWLQDAYWLSLLLGGRGDEIVNFQWNEVKSGEYEDGKRAYWIELRDHKVEDADDNIIPMFDKTYQILLRLGLESKLGTSEYVIAPDIESRATIRNFLGKAWRWYWREVAGLNPKVKWKSLRSTNITLSNILSGDKAQYFKKHTKGDTERIHYMNSQLAAASMFGSEFKDIIPENAIKE